MTARPRLQQKQLNEEYLLLREEQYAVVEEYANAQTFLLNATTTTTKTKTKLSSSSSLSDDAIINAVERLDKARNNVRSNLKNLQEQEIQIQNNNNNSLQQQRYSMNHINLSKRVIKTISYNPSWYSNGLPKPTDDNHNNTNTNTTNSLQTNTIAIAALKASIATIREIEETI
ncbi:hypothetical protein FRACYDRAFT_263748 [Fragilariopsis cylindrus CCMP1102]|uniref:Uncharacterized protein n=1 Tax=Fragilariopsis cylindrus CCMP1102 TaxID=635003 RepID=A0A1E7EWN6_9STRA|nr:hypothetical protein FRACYDRAFT_263748 [Fragilariopsis cylindrus CCMP1102]|eukprot:OEU10448.1 hypothetical protein FRACYDRAFT_263748 [Fragilariopsis cylindrus CCMP1102]